MIEPAVSIDRILLAFLVDGYDEEVVAERQRTVLRLHPRVAPVKAAILPLIGKSEEMVEPRARRSTRSCGSDKIVEYDDGGAIGRRYRRQDEIGTPFAFTVDEQTLEDETVTVRDRDSLAQERLPLDGVRGWLDDALERPWKSPKSGLAGRRGRASEVRQRAGASRRDGRVRAFREAIARTAVAARASGAIGPGATRRVHERLTSTRSASEDDRADSPPRTRLAGRTPSTSSR